MSPQFDSIPNTGLEYVKNTTANIFRDTSSLDHYILLAGRWFRAKSLENGPWGFVDGKSLPEEFANIPESSPKAGVLVSVAGTGPAKEALIANAIPQTATITRNEAQLLVKYDGDPQFKRIEGTDLQYAVNTATPVIQADDKNYYAVENAVWFASVTPVGPWAVATSVPEAIYSIPPSSSLHYVTYVKVYRSTPDVVYVGYTPGYYGTVVSSTTYHGCLRHRLVLSALYRLLLVWSTLYLRSWRGLYVEFGNGLEHHDRCRLYVRLSVLLSLVGAVGLLRSLLLGAGLGIRLRRLCQRERIWTLGQYRLRGYRSCVGESLHRKLWWGKPNHLPEHTTWYCRAWRGGAPMPTSTPAIPSQGVGPWAITRKPALWLAAGRDYAGNMYSGQGAAGRGGFAYNTNTGAGVAAGSNNIYAGKNGDVYRYDRQSGNWSQNSGNGWKSTSRPQANLQQQQQARAVGQQRMQNFGGSMGGGMRAGRRR